MRKWHHLEELARCFDRSTASLVHPSMCVCVCVCVAVAGKRR